jgi:hypothetical protein
MNRLKKIFTGLLASSAVSPTKRIAATWLRVSTAAKRGEADADDLYLIDKVAAAVVAIAEEAEKASVKAPVVQ